MSSPNPSAFPRRAVLGLVAGVVIPAGWAVVLAVVFDWSERVVTQLGVVVAGTGAIAGAVVGGVSDILARLRDLAPPTDGPEADYLDAK
jgi:predicted membrane protein